MTPQEAERRRRQGERDRANPDDHRVLSFRQWCELNGFSAATGRRIIAAGIGPIVTQLSAPDRHYHRQQCSLARIARAERGVSGTPQSVEARAGTNRTRASSN
jgi:hypothetical protein